MPIRSRSFWMYARLACLFTSGVAEAAAQPELMEQVPFIASDAPSADANAPSQAVDRAAAEPSERVQGEYRAVVMKAIAAFDAGRFADARALFLRAHELWPSARTLRTLGMTAFELRMYPRALLELQNALDDPRRPLPSAQREQVAALLERTRAFVGRDRLEPAPSSETPAPVTAAAENLRPEGQAGASASTARPGDLDASAAARAVRRKLAYAAFAVGASATAVTAVTGGLALKRKKTLDAHCQPDKMCPPEYRDERTQMKRLANTATAGVVLGAAGLAAATYLWLSARPAKGVVERARRVHPQLGLGTLGFGGSF